jgi:hypothetical protein
MMDREKARRALDELRTRAYVRNMVADQLEERDRAESEGEPLVTFSVRLPVTELGRLQLLGSYLGHKKTPFASMLLEAAIEDAFYGLQVVEEEKGRLDAFLEHMEQIVEVEGGTVGPSKWGRVNPSNGEGEVG